MWGVPWGVQYRGGYREYRGDILGTVGILSTMGDIIMHVGDIMSTMGGVQYRGGNNLLLFEYPHGIEHPLQYS